MPGVSSTVFSLGALAAGGLSLPTSVGATAVSATLPAAGAAFLAQQQQLQLHAQQKQLAAAAAAQTAGGGSLKVGSMPAQTLAQQQPLAAGAQGQAQAQGQQKRRLRLEEVIGACTFIF